MKYIEKSNFEIAQIRSILHQLIIDKNNLLDSEIIYISRKLDKAINDHMK